MSKNRLSVIVSSCDFFEDCWRPFIYSIKKFWRDCPYDIYIVSNYKTIEDEKVKFITVGQDGGWASNLKKAIKNLDTKYVLYMQEDYWLTREIQTCLIEEEIDYCEANNIDYLRLSFPFMDKFKIDEKHASSNIKDDPYALCLQTVLFNRDSLNTLLIDGWSGWDYERKITDYIQKKHLNIRSEVLLSTSDEKGIFTYPEGTGVRKGKWTVDGKRFLQKNGFENLISKRDVEGCIINALCIFRGKHLNDPLKYLASSVLRVLNKLKWNI